MMAKKGPQRTISVRELFTTGLEFAEKEGVGGEL